MAERIFDETTLRKLDQLTLIANKIRSGAIKGERRSSKRGTSIEFADYRNYVRGDDLRRVDWNIYARLQRPFIKLLEDEEDEPAVARLYATPNQMLALSEHATEVVSQGRPICPMCGQPIDPDGHFCPRRNGHGQRDQQA